MKDGGSDHRRPTREAAQLTRSLSSATPHGPLPHGALMERYMRFIIRHRVAVVVSVLIGAAYLATQMTNLRFEIRPRANLPDEHPYVRVQNRISDLFGGEALVVIGVIANEGNIFSVDTLG